MTTPAQDLLAECREAFERIRRMTFWPYGLIGVPDLTAVQWSEQNWSGIQTEAARMVRRIDEEVL